ncbi:MAG: putative S-layer protein [Candidatus Woesearchaeota archaeon]|jgi:hypothetical protein
MNNKTITLLFASILSFVFLITLASAAITLTNVPTLSTTGNSATIVLQSNTGDSITSFSISSIAQDGKTITFSPVTTPIALVANVNKNVSFNYVIPTDFNFKLGKTYSTTLTMNTSSETKTQVLNFEPKNYCAYGTKGTLEIRNLKIDNVGGFGDDGEWYALDEIEVEVEVKNTGSDDVDEITVVWGLYNSETGKWIIDDEEKSFDLNDEEKSTITFSFQLDPEDLTSSYENYIFYVKAYSDDQGEDMQCSSDSESINVKFDNNFVILSNIKFVPETTQCSQEVQATAEAWNIGSDDQDDVYVIVYNKELGLNQKIDIGSIDSLDKEKISFSFTTPAEISEKSYSISFSVYDEDDEIFENDNDDESVVSGMLKVEGNCIIAPQASVSAVLDSEAKAGKELTIKSTITNIGTKQATYTLGADSYNSWATLSSVTPTSITLNAGERADVVYKLNVNKGIEGNQVFNIEVKTGNTEKETFKQQVQVTIEKSSFNIPGISGFAVGGDNWYLWGIGALNVILVIVIIIVAIRVARS